MSTAVFRGITGAKLKIAASYFSMYAYVALKKELGSVDGVEFIFYLSHARGEQAQEGATGVPHSQGGARTQPLRQRVRDPAPQQTDPASYRPRVRRLDTSEGLVPIQGFTAVDLGYEKGDALSNIIRLCDHIASVYQESPPSASLPDPLRHLSGVPAEHQRGRSAQ